MSAGLETPNIAFGGNGRFTELRRSDLAATIYRALDGKVETKKVVSARLLLLNGR